MNYTKVNGQVIIAISRLELSQIDVKIPFAWITIACPKHEHMDKISNAEYILAMKFVDFDTFTFPGATVDNLFTKDDAQQIVDFVNSLPPKIPIIVNCLAGISRSTAITAAIVYYLDGDDSVFWEKTCPNQLVFQTLCKAFGKEPPERSWRKTTDEDFFIFDRIKL
jgi:predicted protein tyrosine phosphatase